MITYIKYIILFSISINFTWEMAQMPFYENMPWNFETSIFCLIASFGDAIMILIIFYFVAVVAKDFNWILNLNPLKIILSLITGIIIGVLVEQIALVFNMWSYSNLMPLIPWGKIGISPILQMLILPLVVFKLTKYKITNLERRKL